MFFSLHVEFHGKLLLSCVFCRWKDAAARHGDGWQCDSLTGSALTGPFVGREQRRNSEIEAGFAHANRCSWIWCFAFCLRFSLRLDVDIAFDSPCLEHSLQSQTFHRSGLQRARFSNANHRAECRTGRRLDMDPGAAGSSKNGGRFLDVELGPPRGISIAGGLKHGRSFFEIVRGMLLFRQELCGNGATTCTVKFTLRRRRCT